VVFAGVERVKRCLFLVIFAAVVVSACGSDSASYMVDGKSDTAFSLFRDKAYPGADWQLELALTSLPECQRRHPLKSVASDRPYKAELYLNAEGDYFLRSAGTWYQAQLTACTLLMIESAPASPGNLLGTWEQGGEEQGGAFKFFPAGK
jgi:hypothetical protein